MLLALRILVPLAALLISGATLAEDPFAFATTPGKLPKDVVPEDYQIHIVPDLKAFTFHGTEAIRIAVLKPTSRIVLNALEIEVEAAKLSGQGIVSETLKPSVDKESETLAFDLADPLPVGSYVLHIDYHGIINAQPQGLFYIKYATAAGERLMLGTQMESTDARRMMPCWDEPVFRASFRLSGEFPPGFDAYSNMPVEIREQGSDGRTRFSFSRTPKMASYLVVLVAGEFERLSETRDGVDIGVVATAGKRDTGNYALAASKDLLHYYNDYFGMPYPLAKLDQIALPGGFGGAMENWGGIAYSESVLLFDKNKSADSTRQDVFEVVAHEMAHQWFGDLVTMAWWDNLWLNEGFASWMGTKATDRFNPDWDEWLHAIRGSDRAMQLDARKTTHPVQQPVVNETEAGDAFDEITYLKGQGILRMLEAYLGEEAFQAGIRGYISKHQYSSTTTRDLWIALEKASGKPVAKIASEWTTQSGFPIVSVDATCRDGRRIVMLSQHQFSVDEDGPGRQLWSIPVGIGVPGGPVNYTLLQAGNMTVSEPNCDGPLAIDPGASGFFRVEYSPSMRDALFAKLTQLPPSLRLKLLADSWAQVSVGRLPAGDYFDLLGRLGNDPKRPIWQEVLDRLETLDRLSEGEPVRAALRRKAVGLIAPKFKALGWQERPGENAEERELRAELLAALGRYGDKEIIAEAGVRFRRFLDAPASLPPSLINPVTEIAGRYADRSTYDAILGLARSALTLEDKQRYAHALTAASDPKLAAQTLDLALTDVLPQIVATSIPADVANQGHRARVWAFAKAHGKDLLAKVPKVEQSGYFSRIVAKSSDASIADDLLSYVRATLPPEAITHANRTADQIRFQARLKARVVPQLVTTLSLAP